MTEQKKHAGGIGRGYKKIIDWDAIGRMAQVMCTDDDIATITHTSLYCLKTRCVTDNGCKFGEFIARHQQQGKASVRKVQYEMAIGREGKLLRDDKGKMVLDDKGHPQWEIMPISPNATMLVWLGKQWLGQTDKVENQVSGKDGGVLTVNIISSIPRPTEVNGDNITIQTNAKTVSRP